MADDLDKEILSVWAIGLITDSLFHKTLKTLDLIEFRGAAKTGKYFLTASAKQKLKQ